MSHVRMFINEIKNLIEKFPDSTALTVYISSPGGNVDIAVELFHFLKLLDCTHTDGEYLLCKLCGDNNLCRRHGANQFAVFALLRSFHYKKI